MASDDESIELAIRHLTKGLGVELEKIQENNFRPEADVRSIGGSGVEHVIEVKRVTSSSQRKLLNAISNRETSREAPELTHSWTVLLEGRTNTDTLAPTPRFMEPTPEERASLEAQGWVVTTIAEQEAEFELHRPGHETAQVRGLIDKLLPHFKTIELSKELGLSTGWQPWGQVGPVSVAQAEILRITRGAVVLPQETASGPPTVSLYMASGGTRTARSETMASRIQTWLNVETISVDNIRDSFASHAGKRRHAVLVFDVLSEPEYDTMASGRYGPLPTTPLTIPVGIDVIWAIFGSHALSFEEDLGWQAQMVE